METLRNRVYRHVLIAQMVLDVHIELVEELTVLFLTNDLGKLFLLLRHCGIRSLQPVALFQQTAATSC